MQICLACGTEFKSARNDCPVCTDDRQYVGIGGQKWTTHEELIQKFRIRIEDDAGLMGIGTEPGFAINQRALLLPTSAGNILWECTSLVTKEAVAALRQRGGVDMIVISHPHFYAAMARWSMALGGVPVLLHQADSEWVHYPPGNLHHWSGDTLRLSDDVTLIRTGGHFDGSTVLHWAGGPRPGGALFPGDAPQVAMDRTHVAFMYSYPNAIPMASADVADIQSRMAGLFFADIYGFTWGRNILGDGSEAVSRSAVRHLQRAGWARQA
ncbi:MAG: MBL fold metallo-hydrolase [Micropepsaceae bacterium]